VGSHKDAKDESKTTEPDVFVSDTPITDPLLDRFQRYPFAKRVASTLALRADPTSITVLINGRWGEGKTTVLEFIRKEIDSFPNTISVNFNPWRISDETNLLLSFFATIAAAFKKSPKTIRQRLGDALTKYGCIAGELSVDMNGAKLSLGNPITKIGETLSLVSLEEQRDQVEKLLLKAGFRVVVFLDDIDRLDRTEAEAVFKMLKLTANFSNVSYVLAFDRDVVANAIGGQYGGGRAGYEYLEKIIQVNLNLPLVDDEILAQVCLDALHEALTISGITLTSEQEEEFQAAFVQDIAPNLRTPRRAKLYSNAVAFTLPLLEREINPVDVMLLEAIQCLYPQVHENIRSHPSTYTGDYGWDISNFVDNDKDKNALERVQRTLQSIEASEAKRLRSVLTHLFPPLADLLERGKYGTFDIKRAEREQRVAVGGYLKRYLTCSIPAADLSDMKIEEYLRSISARSDPEINTGYRQLLHPGRELQLLLKLRTRVGVLPADDAARLGLTIALNGDLLPENPDDFHSLQVTAMMTVQQCVLRADDPIQLVSTILTKATPLTLAEICFRIICDSRGGGTTRFFTPTDENDWRGILASRIADSAASGNLINDRPQNFGPLMHLWQRAKGSQPIQEHLGKEFRQSPANAVRFLDAFGNSALVSGVDDATYDAIVKFVIPTDLLAGLKREGLLKPTNTSRSARLAQSFAAKYKKRAQVPTSTE